MLELRGTSGGYGPVLAARNLSFTVAPGQTMALIGRNGAGKTTTLRLVAGVLTPSAGQVWWEGEDITSLTPEQRVHRGLVLVPEGRGIFPGLTVEDNLRMGAFGYRPGRRELNEKFDDIYGLLPVLKERRGQAGGSLSGGEQQMLAIGRALMSKASLLLLDEPSLGLSPKMVGHLYHLLRTLKARGVGFILVEQYVQFALQLCDHAVGLVKGEIAVAGLPKDFAERELADVYMGGHQLGDTAAALALEETV
jgi:branched-chain amino acid transport system ATP-binding protein